MKRSIFKSTIVVMLIAALCAAVGFSLVSCASRGDAPVVDQDGNAINKGVVSTLPHGIVYTADAVTAAGTPVTRTFTATVTPSNASNKAVTWSLAWKNAASEWANGKDIAEYLTLSASDKTATLSCAKPFGEQAIITVRSADNPDIYKTCTIDYQKKISTFELDLYQDGTLLGVLEQHNDLDGVDLNSPDSYYDADKKVLKHKHNLKLSINYILDPAHNISFQMRPIFTLGTVGDTELNVKYTLTAGVNISFVKETIYRFNEWKSHANSAPFENLSNNYLHPVFTNTKESPFNPFEKYSIQLGTTDVRNFFFYNGFIASDSQVRDVVNFASNNNLCLLQISYGFFNVNNLLTAASFCFGVNNSTLNVAVADVTLDNSEVII